MSVTNNSVIIIVTHNTIYWDQVSDHSAFTLKGNGCIGGTDYTFNSNTNWYIKQLRDNEVREFDPDEAPWFAADIPETRPGALHTMSDAEVDQLRAEMLRDSIPFNVGRIRHTIPANSPLFVKDILMLRLILENADQRPIYWSTTAGSGNWIGLNDYLIQEGLALRLYVTEAPDVSRLAPGLWVPVDLPRTDSLAWEIYDYAGLFDVDSLDLDPTSRNIAGNLSVPYLVLGGAYQSRGDSQRMVDNFRRAYHLSPNSTLLNFIRSAEVEVAGDDEPETVPLEISDTLDLAGDSGR